MSIFNKQEPTLSEIEDAREHEEAQVSLLQQRVMRKQLEEKMGKGSIKHFKGQDGKPMWNRVYQWLKAH